MMLHYYYCYNMSTSMSTITSHNILNSREARQAIGRVEQKRRWATTIDRSRLNTKARMESEREMSLCFQNAPGFNQINSIHRKLLLLLLLSHRVIECVNSLFQSTQTVCMWVCGWMDRMAVSTFRNISKIYYIIIISMRIEYSMWNKNLLKQEKNCLSSGVWVCVCVS